MEKLQDFLKNIKNRSSDNNRIPVMFVGHGSPMNAIEDNGFSSTWEQIGIDLPRPKAILVISAHWQTSGTWITAMKNPRTIHDFYGFPKEMYEQTYPAPGDPGLASEISTGILDGKIGLDYDWGLDHGTWSVLQRMFPKADIPVLQLSLDASKSPRLHFELANVFSELRNKGVLIIGSGNIVHNLSMMQFSPDAYDWAIEFDESVKFMIDKRDFQSLVDYQKIGKQALLSIPTNEHYLPLLYSLALVNFGEEIKYFNEVTTMGSVSMRSFIAT